MNTIAMMNNVEYEKAMTFEMHFSSLDETVLDFKGSFGVLTD